MPDSAPTPPDDEPRRTDRGIGRRIGRRRLLAFGVAAPIAVAVVRASHVPTSPAGSPQLAGVAIRTPESPAGTPYYFC
jgi:hypothetical protein